MRAKIRDENDNPSVARASCTETGVGGGEGRGYVYSASEIRTKCLRFLRVCVFCRSMFQHDLVCRTYTDDVRYRDEREYCV